MTLSSQIAPAVLSQPGWKPYRNVFLGQIFLYTLLWGSHRVLRHYEGLYKGAWCKGAQLVFLCLF